MHPAKAAWGWGARLDPRRCPTPATRVLHGDTSQPSEEDMGHVPGPGTRDVPVAVNQWHLEAMQHVPLSPWLGQPEGWGCRERGGRTCGTRVGLKHPNAHRFLVQCLWMQLRDAPVQAVYRDAMADVAVAGGSAWRSLQPLPASPLLPPRAQRRTRARGVNIEQQQPRGPAPAAAGRGCAQLLIAASTKHPKIGSAAGAGTAAGGALGAHSPLHPSARGCGRSPGPPFWDSPTASPSSLEPGGSPRSALLLPLHRSSQRPSPSGRKRAGRTGSAPLPAAPLPRSHLAVMLFSSCFFSCRFHMGNLLKVLTYNELEQGPNFFLDFESEMGFLFSFFCFLPYEFHIHAI